MTCNLLMQNKPSKLGQLYTKNAYALTVVLMHSILNFPLVSYLES